MNYTETYINDLLSAKKAINNYNKLDNCSLLITGATGLIGSAVVDFILLNGLTNCKVYAGARTRAKFEERFGNFTGRSDLIFFEYDAAKTISCDIQFDYIIHTASPATPALYGTQPVEVVNSIINGTNEILKYAKDHNTKRVLYVSSSEVYGQKNNTKPYCENDFGYLDITNPRACYPQGKRAAETICATYLQEYGVDYVTVRPGHIYGPTAGNSDNRAASAFIRNVINGEDIVMKSAGTQIRSYCYVVDCVSSILAVLLNGESGKAYNISNPNSIVTIRELADTIAKVGGRKVIFEEPSDAEKKSYNLMDNSSLDSSLIESLGWEGLFDIETGVKHTIEEMCALYCIPIGKNL